MIIDAVEVDGATEVSNDSAVRAHDAAVGTTIKQGAPLFGKVAGVGTDCEPWAAVVIRSGRQRRCGLTSCPAVMSLGRVEKGLRSLRDGQRSP